MEVRFFDRQSKTNPANGGTLSSREELEEIWEAAKKRTNFFAELVTDEGHTLLLGLGPEVGCAQFSSSGGEPPYLMAVARSDAGEGRFIDFEMTNTPTPISERYCFPMHRLKDIAVYFLGTGRCSPGVTWEEI